MILAMKRFLLPVGLTALFTAILFWLVIRSMGAPAPETIATASLNGMREQNRLSAFAANYAAVVTTEQRRYGLSAKKTLIMQGLVRYEVDLSKLSDKDVRWDAENQTLHIRIPPIEAAPPQIDLASIQEYGEGGILRSFTDVDNVLDSANRQKGQAELLRQAKGPVPMGLAREATRRAIVQNFSAPLRAAGLDKAKVSGFFADDPKEKITTRWDYSTPISEIMKR